MKDIVTIITETEKECAAMIEEQRNDHDAIIKDLIIEIDNRKKEEKKRITEENKKRYDREVEKSEEATRKELSDTRNELQHLQEDQKLCDEVREKIISLIF